MPELVEWAWVAAGYTITFVAVVGYVLVLLRRARRVRRQQEHTR